MARDTLYPHLWRLTCEAAERRREAWAQLTDAAAVRARQAWVRERVREMIGPFPDRCPTDVRITRRIDRDTYRIESILFDSRSSWPVTATVYVPKRQTTPGPAILSPCGHSDDGRLYSEYQRIHLDLVREGYVVMTYDPAGQGEREQYLDAAGQRTMGCCDQHCMAGNQLELVGASFANVRIWDGIRALDVLADHPQVDPTRIGVTGNSGGGTLTTWLACLDDRVAAAAPGCFITTLVHRIATRMAADSEQQFTPMLAHGIDHADLLLPLAPKPLLLAAAQRDFFPLEGTRQTLAELKTAYALLGKPAEVSLVVANESHGFTRPLREAVVAFMGRALRGESESTYREEDRAVEEDATLYATSTGQVNTAGLGAIELSDLVRRDFSARLASRSADDADAMVREALPRLLGIDPARSARSWPVPAEPADTTPAPTLPRDITAERACFAADFDVVLRGWWLRSGTPDRVVVMLPDGLGPDWRAAAELARGGAAVLALPLRGQAEGRGELPGGFGRREFDAFYGLTTEMTYTSWMLGRPLLGMRVFDALCCLREAAVWKLPLHLYGRGEGAQVALLTAALAPTVAEVVLEDLPPSWSALYQARTYTWLPEVFLPGVLRICDTDDIAATLAPRPLTVMSALGLDRRPAAVEDWPRCRAAYEHAGAAERLQLGV